MVIVINNSDKQVGLYSGKGSYTGGSYIWNEVSVSTCGGLIFGGGAYIWGDYIRGGGLYSEVYGSLIINPKPIEHWQAFNRQGKTTKWDPLALRCAPTQWVKVIFLLAW